MLIIIDGGICSRECCKEDESWVKLMAVAWPSGKAEACKASIPQFESGCHLCDRPTYSRTIPCVFCVNQADSSVLCTRL